MATLQALAERFGYEDLAVAFPEIDIPVLTSTQRQGDILVLPHQLPARWPRTGPTSLDGGVVIARSEVSSHTHALYGDGQVFLIDDMSPQRARWWQRSENALAWLNVPFGGEAFLMHSDEHGALGVGPGTYLILRQQEFYSDWYWAAVAD